MTSIINQVLLETLGIELVELKRKVVLDLGQLGLKEEDQEKIVTVIKEVHDKYLTKSQKEEIERDQQIIKEQTKKISSKNSIREIKVPDNPAGLSQPLVSKIQKINTRIENKEFGSKVDLGNAISEILEMAEEQDIELSINALGKHYLSISGPTIHDALNSLEMPEFIQELLKKGWAYDRAKTFMASIEGDRCDRYLAQYFFKQDLPSRFIRKEMVRWQDLEPSQRQKIRTVDDPKIKWDEILLEQFQLDPDIPLDNSELQKAILKYIHQEVAVSVDDILYKFSDLSEKKIRYTIRILKENYLIQGTPQFDNTKKTDYRISRPNEFILKNTPKRLQKMYLEIAEGG